MSAYSNGVPLNCIHNCDNRNGYCDHLYSNFQGLMMPYIEPTTLPPPTSHFDTAANDPGQSMNEAILTNYNTIAPSALHGNASDVPTGEDAWTLFETFMADMPLSPSSIFSPESLDQDDTTFMVDMPLSPSSMFSSESLDQDNTAFMIDMPLSPSSMFSSELPDQNNTANPVTSPRQDHPTAASPPPEEEVPFGTPSLQFFYNPNRDILAAKADLINFAEAPWEDQIPSNLLLVFLERVPLPKAIRGRGARKGAKGYYCHWPGCNKAVMMLRLDHAKAHVAGHIDSKPHKCPDCERAFLRPADLKRHNGSRHARLLE